MDKPGNVFNLHGPVERVLTGFRTKIQEQGARKGWSAELIDRVANRVTEVVQRHCFPGPVITISKECVECYLRHANHIREAHADIMIGLLKEVAIAEVRVYEAEKGGNKV